MLEVWREIKVELEQENIRPVSPDADSINEFTQILNDRAVGVSATQVSYPGDQEETLEGMNSHSVKGRLGNRVCGTEERLGVNE